jgi:hypothetical protein
MFFIGKNDHKVFNRWNKGLSHASSSVLNFSFSWEVALKDQLHPIKTLNNFKMNRDEKVLGILSSSYF